jgi:hypothetical protein
VGEGSSERDVNGVGVLVRALLALPLTAPVKLGAGDGVAVALALALLSAALGLPPWPVAERRGLAEEPMEVVKLPVLVASSAVAEGVSVACRAEGEPDAEECASVAVALGERVPIALGLGRLLALPVSCGLALALPATTVAEGCELRAAEAEVAGEAVGSAAVALPPTLLALFAALLLTLPLALCPDCVGSALRDTASEALPMSEALPTCDARSVPLLEGEALSE